MKERIRMVSLLLLIMMGIGTVPVLEAEGTPWVNWRTAAVGDIPTYDLDTYWSFTGSPVSGYENYLWNHWTDVVVSGGNLYVNGDYEIVFDTTSTSSIMGYLTIESKMEISGADLIRFRGRFGCKFSYGGVRTVGAVRVYDKTAGVTVINEPITTSSTANQWKWSTFNERRESGIYTSHDYVIQLFAKDAWISQTVKVAFESAEPIAHAPYYKTLFESDRSSYHCRWKSRFSFGEGAIDDLLRDHRPYVETTGSPYGWDSCYLHEFQSRPYYLLEANSGWYSTNMPGIVDITESDEEEEADDKYEEIEVFTKNPELLSAGVIYYVEVEYWIEMAGTAEITLEAELGNEADYAAWFDPPAMPVCWLILDDEEATYEMENTLSYIEYSGQLSSTSDLDNDTPISYAWCNEWFAVSINGVYPYHVEISTMLAKKAEGNVDGFIDHMREMSSKIGCKSISDKNIPVSVTLEEPMSVEKFEEFIETYSIDLETFCFAARHGAEVIQGQGALDDLEKIPRDKLDYFIDGADFIGIPSFDGYLPKSMLRQLMNSSDVAIVDVAALFALEHFNINLSDFREISWFSQDLAWFVNNGYR